MIKILDVCSGIGGFSLGLEATGGFDTVAFCEYDEFCRKVLNKHWPEVPIYKDLKEIGNEPTRLIQEFDLICGGIPCQPFSLAGKQKGKEDDRHLWPYMYEIIKHKKPTWVIVENVGGFVNVALDDVCLDLETEGYATQSFIIPACGVEAPHRRERIWILGKLMDDSKRNEHIEEIRGGDGEEREDEKRQGEEDSTSRISSGASGLRVSDQGHETSRDVADSESDREDGVSRESESEHDQGDTWLESERSDNRRIERGSTQDVADTNDNGHEGGLSETRNQDVTGQDSQSIRATDTKDSVGQGHDGGDSQQPGADGVVSGSSDDRETASSGATGVRGLSEESNDNEGTSREDGHQEDNDRALVQEGQSRVQSSIDRGLGGNQASSKGTEVRQGTDNDGVNRVRESKDVANTISERSQGGVQDNDQEGQKRKSLSRGKEQQHKMGTDTGYRSNVSRSKDVADPNSGHDNGEKEEVRTRGQASDDGSTGGGTEDVAAAELKSSNNISDSRIDIESREEGQETRSTDGSSSGQDVSNTESIGSSSDNNDGSSIESSGEDRVQGESRRERSSEGTGEDVSYSGSERGRSWQTDRQDAENVGELTGSQEHREGNAESRLGGMVDGISSRLDGHYGFEVEPDIPRVAEKIPDRVNRLKALGNSIVPQVIYHIGMAILEEERKNA